MAPSPTPAPAGLRRELGLVGAVALGIGGTVGGGVYVLVGVAADAAGPAALLSFALAFAMALPIGLAHAELASRHPAAGGGYAFARAAFGRRAGFAMGWGCWGAYCSSRGTSRSGARARRSQTRRSASAAPARGCSSC
jgi:APA family basic amino acid/polyamine antiporter